MPSKNPQRPVNSAWPLIPNGDVESDPADWPAETDNHHYAADDAAPKKMSRRGAIKARASLAVVPIMPGRAQGGRAVPGKVVKAVMTDESPKPPVLSYEPTAAERAVWAFCM